MGAARAAPGAGGGLSARSRRVIYSPTGVEPSSRRVIDSPAGGIRPVLETVEAPPAGLDGRSRAEGGWNRAEMPLERLDRSPVGR